MKQIDPELAARLASGATSLCLCWRFSRRDGAVFGATDHDTDLVVEGVTYHAASGLAGASFLTSAGLAPGRATCAGALSIDFLREDALRDGVWNNAAVDVFRVDWLQPDLSVHVWSGFIGEVTCDGARFESELVGRKAELERLIGRVYARQCDADLGGVRCRVDLEQSGYRHETQIAGVISDKELELVSAGAFEAGWFVGGQLRAQGAAAARIASMDGVRVRLNQALSLEPGEAVTLIAGCDKSWATCRTKFQNGDNFQGFPHLPGPDAIFTGPSSRHENDGGAR